MRALLILVALGGVASADEIDRVAKLGFRAGVGALPIATREARTTSLTLGVEHPTFGRTRLFGEAEWLWFGEWNEERAARMNLAQVHGIGQRATVGLRRALAVKSMDDVVRVFLDAELGGGAMVTSEDRMGIAAVPIGIFGLRLGYDFRNGDSSSRVFEAEFMVRGVIVPTGYGLMFGVGMSWGD